MTRIRTITLLATLPLIGTLGSLQAQVAVTDITYGSRQNDWNSSQGGVEFRNEYYSVENIATEAGDYRIDGPLAQSVHFRRNTGWGTGPNNTTLFYQVDSRDRAWGTAPTTAEEVMLDGNLFTGIRDPFANTGSASYDQNSNIERIDFYFGDYTVQAGDGIILFDLENVGNNGDAFRIAAFDGWNSYWDAPDSYVDTGLLIGSDSFGDALLSPADNSSLEFGRATYDDGDDLSGRADDFTVFNSDLSIVGILIQFTDLGLNVGDTIQGFSLMAPDVSANTSVDLVNWTNSNVFHTNTNRSTHGNVDFMGFGAQLASPVPEPSTYGAIFMGLLGGVYVLRKRRAAKQADT